MYILTSSSSDSYAHEYLRRICLGSQKVSWESVTAFPGCGDGFYFLPLFFPACVQVGTRCSSWLSETALLFSLGGFRLMLHMRIHPTSTRVICHLLPKSPENQKLGRSHPPVDQNPSGWALRGTVSRLHSPVTEQAVNDLNWKKLLLRTQTHDN